MSAQFAEKIKELLCHLCQKLVNHKYKGTVLNSKFCSIDLYSNLSPVPHGLGYYSLIVNFVIGKYESLTFALLCIFTKVLDREKKKKASLRILPGIKVNL